MNKRKSKLWKQLIAAMLAITLLATSVDLQALAAPAEETQTNETVTEENETEELTAEETEGINEADDEEATEADAKILSEVEEKREENSKTFLMSDGTFMVAQYGAPIHYEDENEEWQEIDNTLTEDSEAAVMTADEEAGIATAAYEPEEFYTTTEKAGDRDRIKFSKKLKEGKTVSIKNYVMVNSRGDIEALYNGQGELKVQYRYDSWGKVISVTDASGNEITSQSHIGNVNPFRYRGYYYDSETGFYENLFFGTELLKKGYSTMERPANIGRGTLFYGS